MMEDRVYRKEREAPVASLLRERRSNGVEETRLQVKLGVELERAGEASSGFAPRFRMTASWQAAS
jgi:hypothetical protein